MKPYKILIFILLTLGCSSVNQEQEIIKIFNKTFGKENTKALDEIVSFGENLLIDSYKVNHIAEANELFLKDLSNQGIEELNIGLTDDEIRLSSICSRRTA